jgi:peptidoglycan/xylan/chitin deacetylase (PgdA/CDA1 family)
MKISVVIPTFNRKDSLVRCLRSLADQTFPVGDFEVVVVADGCSDGTNEYLRSHQAPHGLRVLIQENQGPAAAQNAGIATARGDIVILIDDDCVCDPGLVAAHYEAHQSGERLVVLGPVLPHSDTPHGTPGDLKREVELAEFERLKSLGPRRSDLMLCANSSIARLAVLDVPFDPDFKRMHDVEAGLQLWRKGFKPAFAADAVAYELFTKSVGGLLSDAKHQGRYEVSLTETHPELKPYTSLVRINEGGPLKRWLRRQLGIHATLSELLLKGIYGVSESLRALPLFRSIAHRTLRARIGLQHVRGAIEEAGSWKEVERRFGKRLPVIIYHNVGQPRSGEYPGLTTPVPEFEAQIRLLSRMGYTSILPSEWLRWRDGGGELPEKPVMLVFDDGYQEAAQVGFPILRQYGFSAACMIVTNCIGGRNRWDENAGRPSFPIMTAGQILHWSRNGIEFGGHTWRHVELPLDSGDRIEEEILRCKQDLTELLGMPPVSFAYPFGSFNEVAESAVARHFELAFTSWPGRLHLGTNPALVPRIAFLPGESKFGMWCRLRFGRNPFEVTRNRWKRWIGTPGGASSGGNTTTDYA